MFLKSLEIFGFKSFAERCLIEFQGGISAILGPNGCGKSNIVDAIKWVIGEQSAKSLRAERMEDIIFNGSENRKPLNVAEVSLLLANEGGILPLDAPEVEVKRRYYRSGESEYYINNGPVKLKDVRELFFDTGVGKSAYSVMEQGKIDQILSSKPEERRYVFEEAAGITKYKMRGLEAEKKLERTEENMRQIDGILTEVRRSYVSLKAQAEKTALYKALREKFFEIERDIQLLRLRGCLEQKNEGEKKQKELLRRREEIQGEIDRLNQFLKASLDMVNTMETGLVENQKSLYQIRLEKNGMEHRRDNVNDRIGEIRRQEAAARERVRSLEERIGLLNGQIKEKEETLKNFSLRIAETDKNIADFGDSINAARKRVEFNEEQGKDRERDNQKLEAALQELQRELDILTEDIVGQLDQGLKKIGYSHQQRLSAEEEMNEGLKQLRIQLQGKLSLMDDTQRLDGLDKRDLSGILKTARSALEDLLGLSGELENRFAAYKQALPVFLDDFLAPEGIITQKRSADASIREIRQKIEENREIIARLGGENRELSGKIEEYRKTMEDLRINRMQLSTQETAMEESIQMISRDLGHQQTNLKENTGDLAAYGEQIEKLQGEMETLKAGLSSLTEKEKELSREQETLEEGIHKKHRDLIAKEENQTRRAAELGKVQEQLSRANAALAAFDAEIRGLYENFLERHSRDLGEFDSSLYEVRASLGELREGLAKLKEEEKALGQINLMAPEEFAEVKERFDFLTAQAEDLRKAREDLERITSQIRRESTELFLETYELIRKNFHVLFRRLFGGGRAEIKLLEPGEVLTSGIEIYAQPPGKRLENISLLSGGEKSLTAVALLFATYMVKPSPFCILDEIDAALDDQNIGRFGSLLSEFAGRSQFIIITHNKKTVTAASSLLGITMEESGVSKMVAIRLRENGVRQGEPVGAEE
ncbi:MAG: AAA family ATPase [Spirochaetales bacterium]|nr:AAA family ATPase [Spirochaetales bacterium]